MSQAGSLVGVRKKFIKQKRESHPVAHPTNGGSGIAHHGGTSKTAEASRRIWWYAKTWVPTHVLTLWHIHIHKASTACHILDHDWKFTRFLWWKSRDKANELIILVINAIAIIHVAVIFLLLTLFSQKVHLLYPWLWTVGRGQMLRSVNDDFQIIIPRIIFAQN